MSRLNFRVKRTEAFSEKASLEALAASRETEKLL